MIRRVACTSAFQMLTRSSLHCCLQQHGISRLPASEVKTSGRGKFAPVKIGYVHIDSAELRLSEGKSHMFLAIDRMSKFTYVEFRDNIGKINGADFLRGVIKALPYKIHTVLTDNGMAFADLPKNRKVNISSVQSGQFGFTGMPFSDGLHF